MLRSAGLNFQLKVATQLPHETSAQPVQKVSVDASHLCSSILIASAGLQVGTSSFLPLKIRLQTDASSSVGSQYCDSKLQSYDSTSTDFVQQQALSQNWLAACLPLLPYITSVGLVSTSESDPVSFCIDKVQLLPSRVHGELPPCSYFSLGWHHANFSTMHACHF